jgi:hypothetical protein
MSRRLSYLTLTGVLCIAVAHAADRDNLPRVLWHAPPPVTPEHWTCGPGGCDHAPAPPFHFEKYAAGGTNPKVTVKDSRGATWVIKFGAEALPECFASRFVTAVGYLAEPTYCTSDGTITGTNVPRLHGIIEPDGKFVRGRFEQRDQPDFVFLEHGAWRWNQNPFAGTHELAGLKIVMMLLSNWDGKDGEGGEDSNNGMFRTPVDGRPSVFYGVFDWGASLGSWGGLLHRDQCDCAGYTLDTPHFVRLTGNRELAWGYSGKHAGEIKSGISIEDIRWLLPYLERLTPAGIRSGLRASGATPRQAHCWGTAIEARIHQLAAVAR